LSASVVGVVQNAPIYITGFNGCQLRAKYDMNLHCLFK